MTHIYIFQSQPRPECPDLLRLHPPELHPPGLHREPRHHAHYTEQRGVTVGDFTQSAIFSLICIEIYVDIRYHIFAFTIDYLLVLFLVQNLIFPLSPPPSRSGPCTAAPPAQAY